MPERFKDRDELEQNYFLTDAARTADFLDLPYASPNPSPITFKPGSLWVAEDEQPRNEYLYRLFATNICTVSLSAVLRLDIDLNFWTKLAASYGTD